MATSKKASVYTLIFSFISMSIVGCANWSKTAQGGAIGAGAGGLVKLQGIP